LSPTSSLQAVVSSWEVIVVSITISILYYYSLVEEAQK